MKWLRGVVKSLNKEPTVSLPRPTKGMWGRFSGVFGSKFPTLQFFRKDGTWEVVQLRKHTGAFTLVKIRGQIYPVMIDGTRAKTYRYAGVPMAQTYLYSLDDMLPFDPTEWKHVAEGVKGANLPPITPELATLVIAAHDYLERTPDESAVTVTDLVQTIATKDVAEDQLAQFVNTAGVKDIAKPVPDLVEFCSKRMLVDPNMVSSAITAFAVTEREWAALANPARGPFRHWALVGMIVGVVAVVGILGGVGVTQGWFDDLGGSASLEAIFDQASRFGTPELAGLTSPASAPAPEPVPVPDPAPAPEPAPAEPTDAEIEAELAGDEN